MVNREVRRDLWVKWLNRGVTQLSESSQVVLSNIIIIIVVHSNRRRFLVGIVSGQWYWTRRVKYALAALKLLAWLPALWLQAKLTISLAPFQQKMAKLFLTIAAELWSRGCPEAQYIPKFCKR